MVHNGQWLLGPKVFTVLINKHLLECFLKILLLQTTCLHKMSCISIEISRVNYCLKAHWDIRLKDIFCTKNFSSREIWSSLTFLWFSFVCKICKIFSDFWSSVNLHVKEKYYHYSNKVNKNIILLNQSQESIQI
jgi:hypothetical protein